MYYCLLLKVATAAATKVPHPIYLHGNKKHNRSWGKAPTRNSKYVESKTQFSIENAHNRDLINKGQEIVCLEPSSVEY